MNEIIKNTIESAEAKAVSLTSIINDLNSQMEDLQDSIRTLTAERKEWEELVEKLAPGRTLGEPTKIREVTKHRVQWFNTDNLSDKYPAPVVVHGEGCNHIKVSQRDPYMKAGLETVSDVEEWESPEDFAGDYNADFHAEGGNEACWSIAFFPCTGMVERLTITTGYDKD